MEGSLEPYLGVFVPFAATVVLAHLIVRSGSSPLLAAVVLAMLVAGHYATRAAAPGARLFSPPDV